MKVYGDSRSGSCYKIELTCALLDLPYEWVAMDILAGDASEPDFCRKNPNAKIPLLELTDGRTLSESNAIVNFLARGTTLVPEEAFTWARTQQWQFFEQYSHEPYIAVARFLALYLGLPEDRKAEYKAKQVGGNKALAVMDQQLEKTPYLVGEALTVADISLYAYTHVAGDGGFELARFPAIEAWLQRVRSTPGYRGMES